MPSYSSKSQKRSQSQSKNGGRRRKRTLKNVRRRKSRKVMRGGDYTKNQIMDGYNKLNQNQKFEFLGKMGEMYSGGPDVLEVGIGVDVSAAQKAIKLLKEYKVLL